MSLQQILDNILCCSFKPYVEHNDDKCEDGNIAEFHVDDSINTSYYQIN